MHGYSIGDQRQLSHQGGLLCEDLPRPKSWRKEIQQDFYVASDDVGDDVQLLGLISYQFISYVTLRQ